jgi:hypothetical protein
MLNTSSFIVLAPDRGQAARERQVGQQVVRLELEAPRRCHRQRKVHRFAAHPLAHGRRVAELASEQRGHTGAPRLFQRLAAVELIQERAPLRVETDVADPALIGHLLVRQRDRADADRALLLAEGQLGRAEPGQVVAGGAQLAQDTFDLRARSTRSAPGSLGRARSSGRRHP